MAEAKRQFPELVAWLKENRYSDAEIDRILEGVRHYDERVGLDSVMESIAAGAFDLNAVIEKALKKTGGDAGSATPPS